MNKSARWFIKTARAVSTGEPKEFIRNERDMKHFKRKKIIPGYLYFFEYDPKHKATLPHYDTFPLVFPWRTLPDGFIGINLHYLPPQDRAALMDQLYTITSNERFNDNTKLKLSYDVLRKVASDKYYEPCIHRYLYSHVRSKYYKIPSEYWNMAVFLPLERFEKRSKERVWRLR